MQSQHIPYTRKWAACIEGGESNMASDANTMRQEPPIGAVFLVGAGPGDPELITVKARRYLETADVIVYDRLVEDRLLGHARPDAELIDMGKSPGERGDRQPEINTLLVEKAREGKRVVRLKGGDPFIFGRGGEEAAALSDANIPFEVVPGITSAIGVPAYAGIPLTHRGVASSLTVVTGSEPPGASDASVDWDWLAKSNGTLSILMSWQNLPAITQALMNGGRSGGTPCAVIRWGARPYQRTVVGSLSNIVGRARRARMSNPVVVVVGEVVDLRSAARWFDNRPLFGKRVLVTRSRSQSAALVGLLADAGAEPIEVPTIEIEPVDDTEDTDAALSNLVAYDWVVFTSTNSVERLFERLDTLGRDAREFHSSQVAAIGTATAASLRERGIIADIVSRESQSQSLVDGLSKQSIDGLRILLPGAETRPKRLAQGLQRLGGIVRDLTLYRTVLPTDSRARLADALESGIDVVTFTSSSTVTNLVTLLDGGATRLNELKIACIGPVTAETARQSGLTVDIVAEDSTAAGLVNAIVKHYLQGGTMQNG